MPLFPLLKFPEAVATLLQLLGATSVASALALYLAWLSFPPELVIETVVHKSKKFNSESKLRIKNTGRLSALGVKADVENLCATFQGITMKDCGLLDGPNVIGRLSYNETSEISIRPGIQLAQGACMTEFSYTLTLKYRAKFLFLKKQLSKRWKVELRTFEDGYSWETTIL